jgi:low temperature requirement protein LtrA
MRTAGGRGVAMVEQRRAQRPGWVLGGVHPTSEDHRATPFELFFDLVYVFAATQVTGYMAHEYSAHGVLQGLLLLALLWWAWSGYTWLGNQARADEGVLRAGMAIAMAAIFVVALTIPEAWHDAPGGLDGPLVLVGAYLLVRCAHFTLYAVAATGDRGLRHQLAISWGPLVASAALLVPGALVGGWAQTLLFAGALVVDWWASTSPPGRAAGGCTAWPTGPNGTGCSSSWPSASRWSRSGWAPPPSPSAGPCWWGPSWAWPPPCACGGCTST